MKHVVLGAALIMMSVPVRAETPNVVQPQLKQVSISQSKVDLSVRPPEQVVDINLDDVQRIDGQQAVTLASSGNDLTPQTTLFETDLRPPARRGNIPRTRWQHMQGHQMWTRAALSALKSHGQPLVDLVPADIATWCPAYANASDQDRRAFWVGFMSALAKHESTYKPWAVGGGGKWYGLLQILPGTARGYKCNVRTGQALKNGAANLSCAIRIMAHTVPRDGVIHGYKGRRGRGVTADWGPMHSKAKRRDMAGWLRGQNYCKPVNATRPQSRP